MGNSIEELATKMMGLYEELGSWERVGERYGVSRTVAWRIAKEGYEPSQEKSAETRRKLGLPTIEMIPQVRDSKSGQFSKRSE